MGVEDQRWIGGVVSNQAITWAYRQDAASSAKFVLVTLADFADEAGTCFPSQERLARLTGLSVRSVRRAVEELEGLGLLVTEHRYGPNGYRTTDRYRLVMADDGSSVLADNLSAGGVSLPDNLSTPTGHSDRAEENPHMNPQSPPTPPGVTDTRIDDAFEAAWSSWPSEKRGSRKKTGSAFRVAVKAHGGVARVSELVAAVEAHASVYRSWPVAERRYIPLLSTWLNQERWETPPPDARGEPEPKSGRAVSAVKEREWRDAWLSARGITLDEYRDHYEEPGWLEEIERRFEQGLVRQ